MSLLYYAEQYLAGTDSPKYSYWYKEEDKDKHKLPIITSPKLTNEEKKAITQFLDSLPDKYNHNDEYAPNIKYIEMAIPAPEFLIKRHKCSKYYRLLLSGGINHKNFELFEIDYPNGFIRIPRTKDYFIWDLLRQALPSFIEEVTKECQVSE